METLITILGYKLTYLEFIGSIFYFISVILASKANWGNWISSIVGQICFFFLFWNNELYLNSLLQIYFTYICIISIYYWKKTDKYSGHGLRWMKPIQGFNWGMVTIISIFGIYFIFKPLIPIINEIIPVELSKNLFLDIVVTVLSIVGVNLLSLKYIESWIIWIITDVICIILFGLTGIYLLSIEYILITGIAIYGFINWINIYKNKQLKTI